MDKVVYNMSFAKIDQSRRIVSGFATLNNVDLQADVVTTEASVKAFSEFRGNIREQHSKIAAGKMLSFGIEKYFDKVTNKIYDGIFVRAYISKGAPETWEKVIDGTLNGFSIGGDIDDFETTVDDDGNVIRIVNKYTLSELSLVDNPANPLANVVSIEKAHDFFSNIADNIEEKELNDMARGVKKSAEGAIVAPDPEPVEVVEEAVEPVEEPAEAPVEEVVEEPTEVVEEASEVVDDPKAALADETSEKSVESVETEADGSADGNVLTGAINEIRALLESNNEKAGQAFNLIVEQLKELRTGVDAAATDVSGVREELASVKSTVSEFDKRIESVEDDTAVRKSGDLGEVAQVKNTTQKSVWGGRFLAADL